MAGLTVRGQPVSLPAEVHALLAELPAAVDDGLLGLQVWAVSRSVWLAMSLAHRAVLRSLETARGERAERLRARLGKDEQHGWVESVWGPKGPYTFSSRMNRAKALTGH